MNQIKDTFYCLLHRREHSLNDIDGCEFCEVGKHFEEPYPKELECRGFAFSAPFVCSGCGDEICIHQWAFCRNCDECDGGLSSTKIRLYGRAMFAGPHRKISFEPRFKGDDSILLEENIFDPSQKQEFPLLHHEFENFGYGALSMLESRISKMRVQSQI